MEALRKDTERSRTEQTRSGRVEDMLSMVLAGPSTYFLKDSDVLFRRDFQMLEEEVERKAVRLLLDCKCADMDTLLGPLSDYEDVAIQEIVLLDGMQKEGAKAVFCGAGALPLSAVLLAQKGHMRMTCFDFEMESACLGTLFLERFFPELEIDYKVDNAKDFDYSGFDVVFMASMANPKDKILERIYKTNPTAPVITRIPKKEFNAFYDGLSQGVVEYCGYQIDKKQDSPKTMHHSVRLVPLGKRIQQAR